MRNLLIYMYSPKEQFIIYPVILNLNNVSLFILLVISIIIKIGLQPMNIIPNNFSLISESLYRTILLMINNFAGTKFNKYLPLFMTINLLILFSNLIGLIPYSTTPTVELFLTLCLSVTFLIGFLLIGFLTHKLYLLAIFYHLVHQVF